MHVFKRSVFTGAACLLLACSGETQTKAAQLVEKEHCPVELVVLGVGQDAGAPQIGNPDDPAWKDPSKRLYATSLGLLDHKNGKRYLFEATPDMREQMQILDTLLPYDGEGPYIDGIFLTHAHIGHYGGLMFLGRESMGAKGVPVYAMPRMKNYLETSGPWSQLVELGNIVVRDMSTNDPMKPPGHRFSEILDIYGVLVPHRDEFSETVGINLIVNKDGFDWKLPKGPSVIFLPDIDSWDDWGSESELLNILDDVDYAFLDATFYDDNELPGRDMSKIPHPRVTETMDLIDASEDKSLKDKVRFIHINHTNPLRDKTSDAYKEMTARGYKLAYRGERFCL